MSQSDNYGNYTSGTQPIPTTYWRVEQVYPLSVRTVGYIRVSGVTVSREMDRHRSIHHHGPHSVAMAIARRRYPNMNVIITPATEAQWRRWRERQ